MSKKSNGIIQIISYILLIALLIGGVVFIFRYDPGVPKDSGASDSAISASDGSDSENRINDSSDSGASESDSGTSEALQVLIYMQSCQNELCNKSSSFKAADGVSWQSIVGKYPETFYAESDYVCFVCPYCGSKFNLTTDVEHSEKVLTSDAFHAGILYYLSEE